MSNKKIVLESQIISDVLVLVVAGSLDASVQQELREDIERAAQVNQDLVLDLNKVSFMDSSCLGMLVALTKAFRERKGDIKFASATDDVRSIFQITRLDRVFQIFDEVHEAIESYFN